MTTLKCYKDIHVRIPTWFHEQLEPLVDGIEVTDFTQLIKVSLKRYLMEEGVFSPSTPPPLSETPSLTPPLIPPKGGIYPPLNVSPSEPEIVGAVKRRRIRYSGEFAEFWLVFPFSRGNKRKTFDEFSEVISSGVISAAGIISGARSYADRCKRDKTEPKFVKSPYYWLKDERWDDEDKSGRFSVLPELKDNPNQEEPVWLD